MKSIINNINPLLRIAFAAILVSFFLISCKVLPYNVSEIAPANLYRDVLVKDSTNLGNLPWKQVFTDSILQSLISEGIVKNSDLQIANWRIEQAKAILLQGRLAQFPSATANGSAVLSQKTFSGDISNIYEASLSSSWEIDLWGKIRSSKRASLMALKQSDAYKRAIQTELIADIASYYYTLMAYDAKLAITEQSVEIRKQDVESMKLLKESNIVNGAAVVQSEANRYSAEVTLPELRKNIREVENSLSILLGRVPGPVLRTNLYEQSIAVDLKTGVPAQLLANRPDVQQAEYQLRYYAELTNVARAYFYPSITLTAEGGFSSTDISELFTSGSIFGNLIGGITQPLLNQGQNRKRLKVAKAQQEEYSIAFRQKLLTAGKEVSDALYDYQTATEKMDLRSLQIGFLEKSVEYTKELLKYSSATNYIDVLTSEQSLLNAQLNGVNDKQQQLLAVIKLYRSLGGGIN